MLAPGLWVTRPDNQTRINHLSPLSKGLVFATCGISGVDAVTGIRASTVGQTFRSVNDRHGAGGRKAFRFQGVANGGLDFGQHPLAFDLASGPSTYAFYCAIESGGAYLASRCNGSYNSGGWGIRGGGVGIYFNSYNVGGRVEAGFSGFNFAGTNGGTPQTIVITYDGSLNYLTGVKCWIDGKPITASAGFNGVSTQVTDVGTNLQIGGHSSAIIADQAMWGTMPVALLAKRAWTDGEVREFNNNPYGVFAGSSAIEVGYEPPPGPIYGTIAAAADLTGTLTAASGGPIEGTIAALSGLTGTLTGSGALDGSIAATGTFTGTAYLPIFAAGVIAAESDLSGTLVGVSPISGSIAASTVATGVLGGIGTLAGQLAVVVGVSGTMIDAAAFNLTAVYAPDAHHVDVVFQSAANVSQASDPANYTIAGLVVSEATRITDSTYRLTTSRQTSGTSYTVTISGISPL